MCSSEGESILLTQSKIKNDIENTPNTDGALSDILDMESAHNSWPNSNLHNSIYSDTVPATLLLFFKCYPILSCINHIIIVPCLFMSS